MMMRRSPRNSQYQKIELNQALKLPLQIYGIYAKAKTEENNKGEGKKKG